MSDFCTQADAMLAQLIAWRRDFHQHPELGFQETRTSSIVAGHLNDLGIEVQQGVGRTGVVGIVDGAGDGPTVLLRFDMDALPIQEISDAPYRSQHAGVMHACGHDGHTAIGLGVATLLSRQRQRLFGRVKLIFQPAEEGLGGAMAMIQDGVLQQPAPDYAFGLHLWNQLAFGQVAIQAGPLLAAADEFSLTIIGRGSHGAMPHEGIDAVVVAAQVVMALQTIVSRLVDPTETAVLTIGTIHGGQAFNVLAGDVTMTGTVRTFDANIRQQVWQGIETLVHGICQAYGATFALQQAGCAAPATVNDPRATATMRQAAQALADATQVTPIKPLMIAEDMSEFLQRVPGCFALLGAGPHPHPHHNAGFDFDERALPVGVALLCETAALVLSQPVNPG
ncbi:amidohydrolase [Candidatus Amarolinea dominans]|jgi:amidohydrolase|uniref:M20 metallopeptidase family protein n=1 Tax=Candidatus Amarolinea dominans TaxID=3140696 RepID=UPI0031CCA92B